MFALPPAFLSRPAGNNPNFANVALLLHGEGANGGTTHTDSSSHAFTPGTVSGATTSTAIFKYGASSIQFTGSSSQLRFADDAAFTIGTSEFLIECFVRFDDTGTVRYICGQADSGASNASTAFGIRRNADNKIQAFCRDSTVAVGNIISTSTVTSGVWYYIAYGRQGTTFRLFIDAVAEGTDNPGTVTVQNSASDLGVGCLGVFAAQTLDGNVDEFRFVVGQYLDVASIGVPSAAFPNS